MFANPGPHRELQSSQYLLEGQYSMAEAILEVLKGIDDNFLPHVTEQPVRRGIMVNLLLTNEEELMGNVKFKVCLSSSNHKMVKFEFLRAVRGAHSKLTDLHFRRTDFVFFRDLLGRVP